jgi:hypothetical protein
VARRHGQARDTDRHRQERRQQERQLAAGQSTLAWPSELSINDGADYRLSWGAASQTNLKFRTLPSEPVGLDAMASSLIKNNCEAQLDLLIETVRLPEDTNSTSG